MIKNKNNKKITKSFLLLLVFSISFINSNNIKSEKQANINLLSGLQIESKEQNEIESNSIDLSYKEAQLYFNDIKIKQKREVIVAMIDTGVDYNHPDLKDKIWINEGEIPGDGIDNDGNGYVDDVYGWNFYNSDNVVCQYLYDYNLKTNIAYPYDNDDHGTHVAGIIAANQNLEKGYEGIASNIDIKLMILKINGGEKGIGNLSSAINAIKYATMMGADICNMSWGTDVYNKELEKVIRESDMLFIAAAGNTGTNNNDKPVYPASFELDNLISVTFVDDNGKLTPWSNYGMNKVDIAVPGIDVVSTTVGSSAKMSGTSMAAPQITGIAAMLYAYNDGLNSVNIKDIILKNYIRLDSLNNLINYPGIPDANKIVRSITDIVKDKKAPTLKVNTRIIQSKFIVNLKSEDKDGSGVRVIKWLKGEKKITEFKRGVAGNYVTENKIEAAKPGKYTFYISDYAGNERIVVHTVEDDKQAPSIQTNYIIEGKEEKYILLRASDEMSGVKRVKYMKGKKTVKDFLPTGSGEEIALDKGKAKIKIKSEGVYTVYAIDHRGNASVDYVNVKTIKASEIKLSNNRIKIVKKQSFQLRTFLKPLDTTDKAVFKSSNESIVMVNKKGIILAKKEGKAIVTAYTSNGVRTICEVTVVKNKS